VGCVGERKDKLDFGWRSEGGGGGGGGVPHKILNLEALKFWQVLFYRTTHKNGFKTTLNLHFRQQRILGSPTLISFGEICSPQFTFYSITPARKWERTIPRPYPPIFLIKSLTCWGLGVLSLLMLNDSISGIFWSIHKDIEYMTVTTHAKISHLVASTPTSRHQVVFARLSQVVNKYEITC
jgi:hypothetical protein